MKSKQIQKLFIEYMNSLGKNFRYANNDEMPALIYGSDQFKIDIKRSRIKTEFTGWIKKEDLGFDFDLKDIEWIAIKSNNGSYSLIVSSNLDPFFESEENPMYIDGQVFGAPADFQPNIFMHIE